MCILSADDATLAAADALTVVLTDGIPLDDAVAMMAATFIPWPDPSEEDLDEAIREVQVAVEDIQLAVA